MKLITLLSLYSIFLGATSAYSVTFEEKNLLKNDVERRIDSILKITEQNTSYQVELGFKENKVQLPSTPFQLIEPASINIKDEISSIQVQFYHHSSELNTELKSLIQKELEKSYPKSKLTILVQDISGLINTKNTKQTSIIDKIKENIFYLVFFAIFLVTYIFSQIKNRNEFSGLRKEIKENLEKVSASLENQQSEARHSQENQVKNIELNQEEDEKISNRISSYSFDYIHTLLSDCYWTEQDRFACFIWNRVSTKMKEELIQKDKKLYSYVQYFNSLQEEFIDFDQDAVFVNPMPFQNLNQVELKKLLKETPVLLNFISTLRIQKMDLSTEEKLELFQKSSQEKTTESTASKLFEKIKSQKDSSFRSLQRRMKIKVDNTEEESKLSGLKNLTLQQKEDIESFIWSLELQNQELTEILEKYNAKQLASIWIGTEDILGKFSSCVPEKKLELIRSYADTVQPSRQSPVYTRIHQEIVQKLKKHDEEENHEKLAA